VESGLSGKVTISVELSADPRDVKVGKN